MLYQRLDSGPLTRSVFLLHAACARKLVAAAPADPVIVDDAEREFLALRDRIHATGEPFPDD